MQTREYLNQLPSHQRSPLTEKLANRLHLDGPLLIGLFLLTCYGLFVLYSASGEDIGTIYRQLVRFGAGLIAMLFLAQIPPRTLSFWTPAIYIIGLIMLILVLAVGTEAKGAQRWLTLPGLGRFQPSEMMKLATPAMVAWYFRERMLPPKFKDIAASLVIVTVPALLIFKQPDLGTAILIAASGLLALYLAGLSRNIILLAVLLAAISAPLMYNFVLHEYQRDRVNTFLNPEADPLGTGWNIIQSKTAIGSGGLDGKGWLNGTQSRLDFLPESSTDFIFAVLAEEMGLAGISLLLLLYLFIVGRCLWIAGQSTSVYARLLGGSLALTFFIYVVVNIGMVSGLLPVVGVPLPLISYGGTSIVTLLAGFGILMSIHTHRRIIG